MSFWSSQTLEAALDTLVGHTDKTMVDCNSITLRVGDEIYISPNAADISSSTRTKHILSDREMFTVPPGQFGFIVTQERVNIPTNVMGFISLKATFKLMGLINVSGFHVDPGFNGPLVYSVFNAGPGPIHLQRGMPLFLLWIADLDVTSTKHKSGVGEAGISPKVINNIAGAIASINDVAAGLDTKIATLSARDKDLADEIRQMERDLNTRLNEFGIGQQVIKLSLQFTAAVVLLFMGALLGAMANGWVSPGS